MFVGKHAKLLGEQLDNLANLLLEASDDRDLTELGVRVSQVLRVDNSLPVSLVILYCKRAVDGRVHINVHEPITDGNPPIDIAVFVNSRNYKVAFILIVNENSSVV